MSYRTVLPLVALLAGCATSPKTFREQEERKQAEVRGYMEKYIAKNFLPPSFYAIYDARRYALSRVQETEREQNMHRTALIIQEALALSEPPSQKFKETMNKSIRALANSKEWRDLYWALQESSPSDARQHALIEKINILNLSSVEECRRLHAHGYYELNDRILLARIIPESRAMKKRTLSDADILYILTVHDALNFHLHTGEFLTPSGLTERIRRLMDR